MLNLKIIWSVAAIGGLIISIFQGHNNPLLLAALVFFFAFNLLWLYWRVKLAK